MAAGGGQAESEMSHQSEADPGGARQKAPEVKPPFVPDQLCDMPHKSGPTDPEASAHDAIAACRQLRRDPRDLPASPYEDHGPPPSAGGFARRASAASTSSSFSPGKGVTI